MTTYQPRVAFILGAAFSLSMFLTACNKSAPPSEQPAPPPGQSATGATPSPNSPASPAAPAHPHPYRHRRQLRRLRRELFLRELRFRQGSRVR